MAVVAKDVKDIAQEIRTFIKENDGTFGCTIARAKGSFEDRIFLSGGWSKVRANLDTWEEINTAEQGLALQLHRYLQHLCLQYGFELIGDHTGFQQYILVRRGALA